MHSWTSPALDPLPASSLPLRLHDSRTGRIAPVAPLTPGTARLYVCGITPYDSTHLGHAATYHAADLMRRALRDAGLAVEMAQNVTDVDDPLLERARRDGVDWRELAASQTALFASDMEALRIVAPETYRSVSEAMDDIIALVLALHERGRAYPVDAEDAAGPDWYLDLSLDGALGDVSGWTEQQMLEVFAERGGDPDRAGKRGRFDPLLWRAERAGEPAWDGGVLGRGRPGWHVECVCIAEQSIGLPFDVQAGGSDLVFPHHDLGAAHAVGLGRPFAASYAHSGMVGYQGEKMSKSLGNLVFVHRLVRDGVDPMAIRLVLMAHHYRSDWEWTDAELDVAGERLDRYRAAAARGGSAPETVARLRAALRDDLDTPSALTVLDAWADGTGADAPAEGPGDVPAALDALFGIALSR
ncbi:cysteine--1-D-myo-inosityl 2-amino-2-deoxy-alpha-D-glucopyranoside ligase [Brachybacterium saurashtrense]|uniref:L-cysteine:1D-myo-inositol 2-amino-2-deoxy-alpha-D-glucopyranoside ligase n=1 Tax=Brachybacterium saurashtrense TaxID=556288 RepID=A0A345YMJ4_9MICO|nr:cysteine--1-D-myo-inosityl 2-amino-2-deoxy-alpha-D-glucopyranoside ligase [Brachybacterium saurashtrense]AXK45146.1 cysteine--1-D-myo-inosityl 2-amino-2-deoxy-alpha-D-glucopyranoside ligase [Brachybacterium saurashtrense]RRR22101.1 cysteine--1-D-myo-inosityl 2-amino-2-deoxy-alpha-D-glucopyranoside ligase [Brachybacterium saurashtrense]